MIISFIKFLFLHYCYQNFYLIIDVYFLLISFIDLHCYRIHVILEQFNVFQLILNKNI